MILELKEKIDQEALMGQVDSQLDSDFAGYQNEVIEALVALGINHRGQTGIRFNRR